MSLRTNIAITYKCFQGLNSMKDFNISWLKRFIQMNSSLRGVYD